MLSRYFTFSHITLYVALSISAIAAYYSVLGLAAIFAGAVIPIIVMGTILEIAKITTTIWLHRYWNRASIALKGYLTIAVIVLACLTSMGIFGLLSKAHVDSGLQSGDVSAQVAILDEKIATQRENIEAARKTLLQLDSQVNERLARGATETGAERSVQIRRQQASERARLQKEITDAQTAIVKLNEQRAPVASQLRKVEAEVGPVKYIAALIYGDNPDAALLERAVRWVTILIVLVFDPLAIVLILASQNSFRWAREESMKQKLIEDDIAAMSIRPPEDIPDIVTRPWTQEEMDALDGIKKSEVEKESDISAPEADISVSEPVVEQEEAQENKKSTLADNFWGDTKYTLREPRIKVVAEKPIQNIPEPVVSDTVEKTRYTDDNDYVQYQGKSTSIAALKVMRPDLVVSKQDLDKPVINFGPMFPKEAVRGEYFIKIDTAPHTVYQFFDNKWLFVDKMASDVYLQNSSYVRYLIKKLENSEYDVEWLTHREQEEISKHLEQQ